jgi:O-antigen ligase
VSTYILVFLLFFLPLFVFPFGNYIFEPPKVILAEFLIGILAFLTIASVNYSRFREFFNTHALKNFVFLSLYLLSFGSLIFANNPYTFFGNPFRLQGVFLFWLLILFSIIATKIDLEKINKWVFLISLSGLLMGTLILGGNEAGRAIGTLGEPNALAAAAVFIWPFAAAYIGQIRHKTLAQGFTLIVALMIVLLSGSRSGLLAFFLQILFLSLMRFYPKTLSKTVIACLIILLLSFVLPIIDSTTKLAPELKWFENRAEIWETAIAAGISSPILGFGIGNIEYALNGTSKALYNNIQYQVIDSAHNFLLDFWVQGGIIGLGSILVILYFSITGLIKKQKKILLCTFIGILTVMSFNPVSVVTLLAFWFLIGQGLFKKAD